MPISDFFNRRKPPTDRTLLATGYHFGDRPKSRPIYLNPQKLQNNHLICTGGSGSGKSRFLYHLATERMRYTDGVQVIFDPHSAIYDALLNFLADGSIPDAVERLVIIEPVEMHRRGFYIGINVLEVEEGQEPYELIDDQITAYRTIWTDAVGDRMISILRNCSLLACEQNLTLCELNLMLTNPEVRDYLVERTEQDEVRDFFNFFGSFTAKERHFFVESSRNKIEGFTANPYLKYIIGQTKSTISFSKLLNTPGTIILINSSSAHLKVESRRLFDALLFTLMNAVILGRESIPEAERIPVSFFIDESPELYVPNIFRFLLSGSRKFGVSLNLFNQAMVQFPPDDIELIFSNCATKCCFKVDRPDAEHFTDEMRFTFSGRRTKYQRRDVWGAKDRPMYYSISEERENAINQLMEQQVREFFIQMDDGTSGEPRIATAPYVEYPPHNPEAVEALRGAVYERYTRPATEVRAEMAARKNRLLNPTEPIGPQDEEFYVGF